MGEKKHPHHPVNDVPELELLEEAKVSRLLDNPLESRFEASGVCLQAGTAYVVFDNSTHLARFTICAGRLSRTRCTATSQATRTSPMTPIQNASSC